MTWRRDSPRFSSTTAKAAQTQRLQGAAHALVVACEQHDLSVIGGLLSADVTAVVDGGGNVPAPTDPVRGRAAVAELLAGVLSPRSGVTIVEREVNGSPGVVMRADRAVVGALSMRMRRRAISDVWIVLNPDKLHHWNIG